MASILVLKRRIQAAQNVSKTTKAMQMIAASKLKKAQDATLMSRPYVEKLTNLSQNIIQKIDKDVISHPYIKQELKAENKTLLLVLSPDKGLAGGLITNLIREFLEYTKIDKNISYIVIGKKLQGKVVHLSREIIASFNFGATLPSFDAVYPISKLINDYYLNGKVTSVKILFAQFTSIFTQTPMISTILPVSVPLEKEEKAINDFALFEPNVKEILPNLLNHYLEMTIYQNLLESYVSEQAARMISMQNATDNAKDIISDLQLEYNKTRQAKITSEILDIGSGEIKKDE